MTLRTMTLSSRLPLLQEEEELVGGGGSRKFDIFKVEDFSIS